MCTDETFRAEAAARAAMGATRRDFNLTALSAAFVALLPSCAKPRRATAPQPDEDAPLEVHGAAVEVKTADGVIDGYFAHPTTGAHPAILMWPDFMSLRPVYQQLADKLAREGYAVLVINPYYRLARAPIVDKVDFEDEAVMTRVRDLARSLAPAGVGADAQACAAFLDQQPAVDRARGLGTMGYCMGGGNALVSAAAVPERFAALVSFHGNLRTDEPDSPHLLIPRLRARALVAIAANDDSDDPQEKEVVRQAFAARNLPAEVEVYAGTQHGWCTPDMVALYDADQAARAWERMLARFGEL